MKEKTFVLVIVLIGLSYFKCTAALSNNIVCNVQYETKNDQLEDQELFNEFIVKFCFENEFQLSRIVFPVKFTHLNDDFTEQVVSFVKKEKWKYINLGLEIGTGTRTQIYDNFAHSLRESDERVFAQHGINNGIEVYYYFKRIKGLWFLLKYEDLST